MPTDHSWKTGLECWKWMPYKARLLSNSIQTKEKRNGPPSANQVVSKDEPRRSHVVCTLRVYPPTSPYPALSAEAEPTSKGYYQMWHHGAESLMMGISAMGPKESKKCIVGVLLFLYLTQLHHWCEWILWNVLDDAWLFCSLRFR